MPLELLDNPAHRIDYGFYQKNYVAIRKEVKVGDIFVVDIIRHPTAFPYHRDVRARGIPIEARVVAVQKTMGLLLEFPDDTIIGHNGDRQDGSHNRWWI